MFSHRRTAKDPSLKLVLQTLPPPSGPPTTTLYSILSGLVPSTNNDYDRAFHPILCKIRKGFENKVMLLRGQVRLARADC